MTTRRSFFAKASAALAAIYCGVVPRRTEPTVIQDLSLPRRASVQTNPELVGKIQIHMDGNNMTDRCVDYDLDGPCVTVHRLDANGEIVTAGRDVQYETIFARKVLNVYRS